MVLNDDFYGLIIICLHAVVWFQIFLIQIISILSYGLKYFKELYGFNYAFIWPLRHGQDAAQGYL